MGKLEVIAVLRHRTDLLSAIRETFPDLGVASIDENGPLGEFTAPTWCFVESIRPKIMAYDLCKVVRQSASISADIKVWITFVIEEPTVEARRKALTAGADDYLLGPLTPRALVERLRDYNTSLKVEAAETFGDFTINRRGRQIRWQGRTIELTTSEFELLAMLIANRNRLLSLPKIIQLLGKAEGTVQEQTPHAWIGRLRRTLVNQGISAPIRTVWAMGYIFDLPDE